jgi:hypothetical protein
MFRIIRDPNGNGKSYLLNGILEVFNELVILKNSNTYKIKRFFTLEYTKGINRV